jgi:hypothetical protein
VQTGSICTLELNILKMLSLRPIGGKQNPASISSSSSFSWRSSFANIFVSSCTIFVTHVEEGMKGNDNVVYMGMKMTVWMTG